MWPDWVLNPGPLLKNIILAQLFKTKKVVSYNFRIELYTKILPLERGFCSAKFLMLFVKRY